MNTLSDPIDTAANRGFQSTSQGSSALAVIRLIGPGAGEFIARHFSRPTVPGRAVHGDLIIGNETLDDPLVVRVSPTAVDLCLHGSPYLVQAVLALARSNGFAIEKTRPSAADFPEAEGLWPEVLASLPHARTPLAVRALLAQPAAWAGVTAVTPTMRNDRSLQTLLSLPTVALVGPANVGKSTLANTLFGQQRSIVADQPGTTRDWVGAIADVGGLAITLVDTPGIRDTEDPIERAARAASAAPVAAADLVVVVLDHSADLMPAGRALICRHPKALRVANKSDRSPAWSATEENAIETVATNDPGVEALRRAILDHFGCATFELGQPRLWTKAQREREFRG